MILQEKKRGDVSKEVKALGFEEHEDHIVSLIKRFEAKDFADLIIKLDDVKF